MYKGRYQNTPMPCGCLYLNNRGTRWVTKDMRFLLKLSNGTLRLRLADCYEQCGNFAVIVYRHRGRQYKAFVDSELNDFSLVIHKER
jgi:hypothetical protein